MAKELSLMGQLRKEADRDFNRYLKYVNEIFEENKMLHEELGKLHSLWSKDTKHIAELEEENKKLKSDLAFERTMLDNVRAEYDSLQNVIKKLEEELENTKKEFQQYKEHYNIEKDRQQIFLMTGRKY